MEDQAQSSTSASGGKPMAPGRVKTCTVTAKRQTESRAGTSTAAHQMAKTSNKRGLEETLESNATTTSKVTPSFKRQRVDIQQDLDRMRACDEHLVDLGETELRLLSAAAYLDPTTMPLQVLEKFCLQEEDEVKEALQTLVSRGIFTDENNDNSMYTIPKFLQAKIRKVISNEPDILFNLISILESEINSKNQVEFPYINYIRHINLCAIELWNYFSNHLMLVEKCWKSLEIIVSSAFEEKQSTGTILLFLSKSVRILSKLFGCNDMRTVNLRIRRLIITAENGKSKEALVEIDEHIKLITNTNDSQLKSLWIKAVEVKIKLLKMQGMLVPALHFCDEMIKKMITSKVNNHEIIQVKHLRCEMLFLIGRVAKSIEACQTMLSTIENIDAMQSYANLVRCTLAQCYTRQKNFQSALTLMKVVVESRTKELGATDCLTLLARSQVVEILMDMKNYRGALTEVRSIIKLKREKYSNDPHHEEIVQDKFIIARIYSLMGRKKKVTKITDKISEDLQSSKSNKSNSDYQCQLKNLIVDSSNIETADENSSSSEEDNSKQVTEEEEEKREAVSLEKQYREEMLKFGESSTQTLNTLEKLADIQYKLNNNAAALVAYENLYKNNVIQHGVDNKKSIEFLYKISDLQLKLVQYHKALENFRSVSVMLHNRSDCKKLLVDSRYGLALCNMKLANVEEAWNISRQLLEDTRNTLGFKVSKYEKLAKFCQNLFETNKKDT